MESTGACSVFNCIALSFSILQIVVIIYLHFKYSLAYRLSLSKSFLSSFFFHCFCVYVVWPRYPPTLPSPAGSGSFFLL